MKRQLIETRFTDAYEVEYPIVSAGMAFASGTSSLPVAVCNSGGVGGVGVGPMSPEELKYIIRQIRASTSSPFHINFITCFVTEKHIDICIKEKVPIVSFHFGHPGRVLIEKLQSEGIKVWEQVGSLGDAIAADEAGVDLIIVQGAEAGGHNKSELPVFVLVPLIARHVSHSLILAAGGIVTGQQIAAALCLGADGVVIGTRLVASAEAYVHEGYKQRLITEQGSNTVLTSIFGPEMPDFNPMRVIKNGIVQQTEQFPDANKHANMIERPIIGTTELSGKSISLKKYTNFLPTPVTQAPLEELPLAAGQGLGMFNEIQNAGQILHSLMEEAMLTFSKLEFCRVT